MNKLTLIIPAKNEEESLPKFLSELKDIRTNILIILPDNDQKTKDSIKNFDNTKLSNLFTPHDLFQWYSLSSKESDILVNNDGTITYNFENSPTNFDTLIYTVRDVEGCASKILKSC